MRADAAPDDLAADALSADAQPETVRAALGVLLERDAGLGLTTAFDILARGPRIKPSRGLLIDPADSVWRRWGQRVAAGAALVSSPVVARVFDEVREELAESVELARDVLDVADPHPGLDAERRAALLSLRR